MKERHLHFCSSPLNPYCFLHKFLLQRRRNGYTFASSVHLARVVLLICLATVLQHGSKLGKMLITPVLM